jgi:putative transposase
LVLRHENAVLRRHVKRVRYEPADRDIVLIFIEHGTRRLHIAGVTPNPTGSWGAQQARNLAMDLAISMDALRFLVRDRDTK